MKRFYIGLALILMFGVVSCKTADKKTVSSDPIIGKWQVSKVKDGQTETVISGKKYLLLNADGSYAILKENSVLEQGAWAKKQGFLVTWLQKGGSTFSLKIVKLDAKTMQLESAADNKKIQTFYKKVKR